MSERITVQELKSRLESDDKLQMIDVRSPGEFAAGHVPQAINIPLEQVESRVADLDSGHVAILCQSGTRAGMACTLLQAHHDKLMVVEGGTKAWIDAGMPVVRTTANTWSLERQVRFVAGLLVLAGTLLSVFAAPGWVYLAMFVGAGLTFAGLTNVCGMAMLLAKLPWNRPAKAGKPLQENYA